ncbi:MAG: hypothetical protein ACR2HK_12715 [Gemmatimonadales bacterium]
MRPIVYSALVLLGFAPPLEAQNECLEHVRYPAVGRWAEYDAVYKNKDRYAVRYAIIGSETREGTDMKWIELRMTAKDPKKNMIYQMLVPGTGPSELGKVEEIIFKPGNSEPVTMNGMMVKMIQGQIEKSSVFKELCKGVTLVGEERVTVPAGSFKALHFQNAKEGSDSWISADIPFALVKSSGKDYQVGLSSQGDGAESSITEDVRGTGGAE